MQECVNPIQRVNNLDEKATARTATEFGIIEDDGS
jgi:hypothetical protein